MVDPTKLLQNQIMACRKSHHDEDILYWKRAGKHKRSSPFVDDSVYRKSEKKKVFLSDSF